MHPTLRSLLRAPGFTLAAVLTLGLGMAAAVTLFSALHATLLREPPFPGASRLHQLQLRDANRKGMLHEGVPMAETAEVLRALPGVEAVGFAVTFGRIDWEGPQGRVTTGIYRVEPGLAPILGWRPFLGAWFAPGAPEGWILSHRFWKQHLRGDPQVIGRPLTLGMTTWPVVGISQPDFELPVPRGRDVDVLKPLELGLRSDRAFALVRLSEGVDPAPLVARLGEAYRLANSRLAPQVKLVKLREVLAGRMDKANLYVFALAGLMLALAAASVAGLFLARAAERTWEISLRRALGAPERRILAHFLTEGTAVSMAASLLGFGAAAALSGFLRAWLPGGDQLFRLEWAWAHAGVAAFTLGVGLVLACVLAMVPLLYLRKVIPGPPLARSQSSRAHGTLVVVQVAVATLLLSATALLSRSLLGLLKEDRGFRTQGIVEIGIEEADYQVANDPAASSPAAVASMHRVLQALRTQPGIEGAAMGDFSLDLEGRAQKDAPWSQMASVASIAVGDGWTEALGVRLLEGRTFTAEDHLEGRRVCLLDAVTARILFPGGALGRTVPSLGLMRFQLNTRGYGRDFLPVQPLEVVGTVAPIRPRGRLDETSPSILYVPSSLGMMSSVFVRSELPARQVREVVASVLKAHLPTLAAGMATSLEEARWSRLLAQRQTLGLVSVFGVLSLVLASLGIGGLLWGEVIRRKSELGLRAALGASPSALLARVLHQGLVRVSLGLGMGLLGTLAIGRGMRSLLYGLSPTDPIALAGVVLILAASGLVACLIPALHAARIQPAKALRSK